MTLDTYRAKPVEIQAIRWRSPEDSDAVRDFIGEGFFTEVNFASAKVYSTVYQYWHVVKMGDWIVKSPSGEYYPVDNKEFWSRYEKVPALTPKISVEALTHGLGAS